MNAWIASFLICLAWLPATARADKEMSPYAFIAASPDGRTVFKMLPAKWRAKGGDPAIAHEGLGIAYRVRADGSFQEFWRIERFYAFELFIDDTGKHLIAMGPWGRDQEGLTDLAIRFYETGALFKQYRVKDLIKDATKIERPVHHYSWRPEIQTRPNGFVRVGPFGGTWAFHLVTIDRVAYAFDVRTGAIVSEAVDEGAKSHREVRGEEDAQEAKEANSRAGQASK